MSMLSDFISQNQISKEAIIAASAKLERPSIADRETLLKRGKARADKKSYGELGLAKPKARGRGLTADTLQRALDGHAIPRLARSKITRAVNDVLTSKKQSQIDGRPLFGDARVRKGKKKAK
jgi:hypothetical protein